MKNIFLVFVALLFSATISLAGDAPAKVKQAFNKKFPGAEKVKWEKENSKEFEANFEMNGIKMSANFSLEGTWMETEMEIPVSNLPAAVKASIDKDYPGATIKGADKIESAQKGILYEADLKKGLKTKEVLLDEKGNFIK